MDKKQISLKKFPTITSEDLLKIYGGNLWKDFDNLIIKNIVHYFIIVNCSGFLSVNLCCENSWNLYR